MAIKVTNFPRSVRPQYGLTLADHVYEYYLENLITRFIGVFYGNDASRVGPVRSGRFFDEHIVRMYKAIFVFAYADDRVVDPWSESDLRNFLVIEREDIDWAFERVRSVLDGEAAPAPPSDSTAAG